MNSLIGMALLDRPVYHGQFTKDSVCDDLIIKIYPEALLDHGGPRENESSTELVKTW